MKGIRNFKGLKEQLVETISPKEELRVEDLTKFLSDIFFRTAPQTTDTWTHYKGVDDSGPYSYWCSGTICTGDKGFRMILEKEYELNTMNK